MNKKIIFIFVLIIFCSGMIFGTVAASHTYHKGKYSFTVSDAQYNKIENAKKNNGKIKPFTVKTGSYKTYKVPKYKTKKVTKYKWKYKKVKTEAFKPYTYNTVKLNDVNKYYKNGWKKHSSGFKSYNNQKKYLGYNYVILKKKVPQKVTKKVKVGTKKIRVPVKASVGWYKEDGETTVYVEYIVESKNMVYYSDGTESVLSKKLGYYDL